MSLDATIRRARQTDRNAIIAVEAGATPNLSYVANVFDMFMKETHGEFCVAEVEGEVVACGKFTVLPDRSAWLETIRVLPDYQGHGIGKRFYQRFLEIAQTRNITTLRMYTGTQNRVSKGLAEHFGFQAVETFGGAWMALLEPQHEPISQVAHTNFQQVTDPDYAADLVLAHVDSWNHFFVMNRTFYKLTPSLCTALVEAGQIYADPRNGSVVIGGARFMPETALHIGHFSGDTNVCLDFAMQLGIQAQSKRLSCLFPLAQTNIQQRLIDYGFQLEPSRFIVMERQL